MTYPIYEKKRLRNRTWIQMIESLFNMGKELEDSIGEIPGAVVDTELNKESSHAVQNKAIAIAIENVENSVTTAEEDITQIETDLGNKVDKSETIRNILIGTDEVPPNSLGNDGDLYIYKP